MNQGQIYYRRCETAISVVELRDKRIKNNRRNMVNDSAKKRVPAKKARISDMVTGKYFAGSKEELKPSYIITSMGQKISRVNLIATVIDKFMSEDGTYISLTVDDGTDAIRVKAFKENVNILSNFELGELINAIGKLKEYNGEIYINAEIAKRIEDPNYENLRNMEILKELIEQKKIIGEIRGLVDQLSYEELREYAKNKFDLDEECLQNIIENLKVVKEIDYKPKVLEVIDALDKGDGVEISQLLQISDLPQDLIEKTIDEMLGAGMLFEPVVGKLKKV